jgi:hypothetical protein
MRHRVKEKSSRRLETVQPNAYAVPTRNALIELTAGYKQSFMCSAYNKGAGADILVIVCMQSAKQSGPIRSV